MELNGWMRYENRFRFRFRVTLLPPVDRPGVCGQIQFSFFLCHRLDGVEQEEEEGEEEEEEEEEVVVEGLVSASPSISLIFKLSFYRGKSIMLSVCSASELDCAHFRFCFIHPPITNSLPGLYLS